MALPVLGAYDLCVECGGGYFVAHRLLGLKEQFVGIGRQESAQEQNLESTETEQMWLERLAAHPPILDSMKRHSYINPPNREIISRQIESLAGEQVHVESLLFDPEKVLRADREYSFCAQQVRARFSAQDDRQVMAWLQEVERQLPGFCTLTGLEMNRGSEHTVTGEVLWEWSFLRLSLQSAS